MLRLDPFDPADPTHAAVLAGLWNAACGPRLAITPEGVRYNTAPVRAERQAGLYAFVDERLAGFVLASEFSKGDPGVSPPDLGWIEAIAVAPPYRGRGAGAALLAGAEAWLATSGCRAIRLGGGLRPFAPGLPSALDPAFFVKRGYAPRENTGAVWDVERDLRTYDPRPLVRAELAAQIRPAEPPDAPALDAFFRREFPGRWAYEQRRFLDAGGRISDFAVIDSPEGIEGFCWLTFEDSARPLDRCFPAGLPRPWGHLGPVGVAAARRGGGWGAAVLDAGLRRLRDAGVAGCVIDWTHLLDFYARFGFRPYRRYEMLVKAAGR